MLLAGCLADDLETSTIVEEIAKQTLQSQGFTCRDKTDAWGITSTLCTRCEPVTVNGRTVTVCTNYTCTAAGECTHSGDYIKSATFAADLNFWFEAEAGALSGAFQLQTDGGASAGSFVYASSASDGASVHTLTTPHNTSVYGWARVIAPSTASSSMWMQLDNTQAVRIELPVATTWTWVPLRDSSGVTPSWWLSAGDHTVRLLGDEAGVKIDRVLLTESTTFVPVVATIQAETAGVVAPMVKASTLKFPQVGYVWVPNGTGTNGLAQLSTNLPRADRYAVWGRVQAPTTADNSLFIGAFGDPRAAWETPTTSTGWAWDRADIAGEPIVLDLDAWGLIEIAQREDGIKVDQLVVTNDPGFTIVEPPPMVMF